MPDRDLYRKRLLMWLLLILLHLVTSFHRVSFNVAADLLTAEFALTGVSLGNLAAAYTYMYVIMQLPGGVLVDRLGPRRIAFITGLSMALGALLIGFSTGPSMVFLGRMLIGFGGSVVLINIFKFQIAWYRPTAFATMSGLALLVSGSGALLGATPLALSIGLIGWRSSFVLVGLLTVPIALFSRAILRDRPTPAERRLILGEEISEVTDSAENSGKVSSVSTLLTVIGNRRIWPLFLINFGLYGGFIVFSGTWGISYLVHVYAISVQEASVFMVLAYLGYMLSAPVAGWSSDRLCSRKKPAMALIILCVLFWLLLTVWPSGKPPLELFYPLSLLLGAGTAANILTFPMALEVSAKGYTGAVTAVVNLGVFLGLAILQPLFGYVLDLGWEGLLVDGVRIYSLQAYRIGFIVCLFFTLIALTALSLHRETGKRR